MSLAHLEAEEVVGVTVGIEVVGSCVGFDVVGVVVGNRNQPKWFKV